MGMLECEREKSIKKQRDKTKNISTLTSNIACHRLLVSDHCIFLICIQLTEQCIRRRELRRGLCTAINDRAREQSLPGSDMGKFSH